MAKRVFSTLISLFFLSISFGAHAASVTVNVETDSFGGGDCSLRNAIESVNTNGAFGGCVASGGGAIDTVILGAGDYVLSVQVSGDDTNASGDLDVLNKTNTPTEPLTFILQGAGSETTTIDASGLGDQPDRVLHLNPTNPSALRAEISGVTITGGNSGGNSDDGGGIANEEDASTTLANVIVRDNFGDDGGGIANEGDLILNNCRVTINHANPDDSGGGIWSIGSEGATGLLEINNSTISGNTGGQDGGGIAFAGRLLRISNSTVSGNTGGGEGGGLSFFGSVEPSFILNSTFSNNTVLESVNPEIKFGIFLNGGFGGGIFAVRGPLNIINTTISTNTALAGGGGVAVPEMLPAAPAPAPAIKFGGTQPPSEPGPISLFNVTVAKNIVTAVDGPGGGILIIPPPVAAGTNGPIPPELLVINTLIAQNTAGFGTDCSGTIGSGGYNLLENGADCTLTPTGPDAIGDKVGETANIGPLQPNGGPTDTHALLLGSPAIDMANNVAGCQAPDLANPANLVVLNQDQRAFLRPVDATGLGTAVCDIGAFEFGAIDFEVTKVDDTTGPVTTGDSFNYTITVTNTGVSPALDVTLSDPVPAAFQANSASSPDGDCSVAANTVSCTFPQIDVGQSVTVTINVTVVTTTVGDVTNIVTVTGGGDQTPIEKQAQVTTQVIGDTSLLLFGGGCNRLVPVGGAQWIQALWLAIGLGYVALRKGKGNL